MFKAARGNTIVATFNTEPALKGGGSAGRLGPAIPIFWQINRTRFMVPKWGLLG